MPLNYDLCTISYFNVWKERAYTGGHLNFITGAGGYLQNVLYGYAGLELMPHHSLRLNHPVLPPNGIEQVRIRGLTLGVQLSQVRFSIEYNATALCVWQTDGEGELQLRMVESGHVWPVPRQAQAKRCVITTTVDVEPVEAMHL